MEERVRREVVLPADPERVWASLTRGDDLSAWFGGNAELEPRPGGAVRFAGDDGRVRRGVVETCDPPRRLAFRWREIAGAGVGLVVGEPSTVTFELEPVPSGTRLVVVEAPGLLPIDPARAS